MANPTFDDALEAIDRIVERSPEACMHMGLELMVPWRLLAFELFPRGTGGWVRPKGAHGRDTMPAVHFMDTLGQDLRIRVQYRGGQHYYGRRVHPIPSPSKVEPSNV